MIFRFDVQVTLSSDESKTILFKRFCRFGSLITLFFTCIRLCSTCILKPFPSNYVFQFYDNLVKTGTKFLILDQADQAGIMYHSKSNLLGIEVKAYRSYSYTGLTLRYVALGELKRGIDVECYVLVAVTCVDLHINYPSCFGLQINVTFNKTIVF